MSRGAVLFGQVGAVVLLATAMRRYADVGDVLGAGAFWAMLAIATVVLMACARSVAGPAPVAARASLGFVALGSLWILAVPTEPAIAAAALGLGLAACLLVGMQRLAGRLQLALLALLVVVGTTAMVDTVAMMRVTFGFMTSAVAWLFQGLGMPSASAGDQLVVEGPKLFQPFRATANTLGLAAHGAVAGYLLLHRWLARDSGGLRWWSPLAYLPVAVAVRFALLVGLGVALDHGTRHDDLHFDFAVFLDWRYGLALDLAAALVAGWFFLHGPRQRAVPAPPATPVPPVGEAPPTVAAARPLYCVGAVVLGLFWSSDRILDCFGAEKGGRVAIEELHSRWESSDIRLTRDHYGQESGYNLRGLADWLEGGYGPIRRLYDPIDAATLRDIDVLVIKTPTERFSEKERQELHEYVAGGGGLVLIGDHTNVYGTSEILNEIAMPYGFRFEYDCCFDHRNRFEFCYRKETEVRNHPIVRGLETILFEVGCTIDIDSPRVRPVVVGRSLKSQLIDYSVENFYGTPRDTSEQHSGQFPLLVTRSVGEGRVVAVADSTLFSTFSVFMPGRREIVEGMLAFANRRDVGESWRAIAQRVSIGLTLVLLLFAMYRAGITMGVTCALLAWGSSNLGVAMAEAWVYSGNPDLQAANAERDVKFVWEDEPLAWPVYGFSEQPDLNYDLFFQFVARTGAFPRLVRDVEVATRSPGPLVWIDPSPDDPDRAVSTLDGFVERGGTVIVMESEPNAVVTELAGRAGLELADAGEQAATHLASHVGRIRMPAGVGPFRSISGGKRAFLALGDDAGSVGVVQERGRGRLVVLTCGELFSNANYGFRYGTIPDESQRRMYEVQYSIMAAATGSSPGPEESR